MRCVAFAVLLLALVIGSWVSTSSAGKASLATAQNWSQTSSTVLKAGIPGSVTLTPCPDGADYTSGDGYDVYINDANPESVSVTSGSAGSGGCLIAFTPHFSHSNYTIGSASSGIQETINAACRSSSNHYKDGRCNITIPARGPNSVIDTYNVYGTIFFRTANSILSGYGVSLSCFGRGPCLQIGRFKNSNDCSDNTVTGLDFASTNYSSLPAYSGVRVTNTLRTGGVATITTAVAHAFRTGDMVTIMFTDDRHYWGDAIVTSVPSSTTFTYAHTGTDIATQSTPGVVALAYTAILDSGENTHFIDITNDGGWFNNFFDMRDDENATIDHFKSAGADVTHNANWSGSFIFSAGNQSAGQIAPVISLLNSSITSSANGVTVYNSNGLYIENTVIQGTSLWQVHSSNETGNYQGVYLKNIYAESTIGANPLSPAHSPFPGLGIAGLIVGGGEQVQISGLGGVFRSLSSRWRRFNIVLLLHRGERCKFPYADLADASPQLAFHRKRFHPGSLAQSGERN